MINYNVLYLIITKLDTKTLFNLHNHKEFQQFTDSECKERINAAKIIQKYSKNYINRQVKWTNSIGKSLINSVQVNIGGTVIDNYGSKWLNLWHIFKE